MNTPFTDPPFHEDTRHGVRRQAPDRVVSCSKLQETQVAEAIYCPSCSTRYRLRPERVEPTHLRAKCFTCGGIFPLGEIVLRLFPAAEPAEISSIRLEDMLDDIDAPMETVPEAPLALPTLTLGDLDGVENEILDKTLIETPVALPEMKTEDAATATHPGDSLPEYPPEITETTLSGYTSARDAIDKLFGDVPTKPKGPTLQRADSNPTDLEATLSALESTLSGAEPTPHALPETHSEDSPTHSGSLEEVVSATSTSTMRLSQAEILAAMNAAAPQPPEEAPKPLPPVPPAAPVTPAAAPIFAPAPMGNPESGAEFLRLKIGEEIYGGLTMPQLIAWVEEGRILENHLVARQHSENWLEAHKVPGLRPVFERLRRERLGMPPSLDSGIADSTPKKSLFGGLFGKN